MTKKTEPTAGALLRAFCMGGILLAAVLIFVCGLVLVENGIRQDVLITLAISAVVITVCITSLVKLGPLVTKP